MPLLAVLLLAGCEGVDGNQALSQSWQEWVAPDEGFRVTYVSPPWEVIGDGSGERIELEIAAELFGTRLEGTPPTHLFRMEYVDVPEGLDELLEQAEGESLGVDDLLPDESEGFDPDDFDPDDLDTEGFDSDGEVPEIPEYLRDIDLSAPRDVALGELRHLVDAQGAQLDEPLQSFVTRHGDEGVFYQVVVSPGIFVRAYYFPGPKAAIRALFASAFDLRSSDIAFMAGSIDTRTQAEMGASR